MSPEREVLDAVAEDLTLSTAVAYWVADDDRENIQPEGTVGIWREVWPEDVDSVTLATYAVSDDPTLSDSVLGLQVTIRSRDFGKVLDISADVFNRFHGRPRSMLGAITLVSASRQSATRLGQDGSNRLGRSENYYLTIHRPSTYRT